MSFLQIFAKTAAAIALLQITRYLLFAGIAYLALRWASRSWIEKHRVQPIELQKSEMIREFKNSLGTLVQYALILALIFSPWVKPHTQLYNTLAERGVGWLVGTFVFLIFYHDAYFYWMHRVLHYPAFFRRAHHVHHQSLNPSPWASQSFHPIEAFFEIAWILPIVFILPLHKSILLWFSVFSLAYNVYGHLSVEIYPSRWRTHSILRWLNTSTHHNGHHRYFKGNYGLYFMFWDRLMKTER